MRHRLLPPVALAAALGIAPTILPAQAADTASAYTASECPSCAQWNAPQRPFRIHGNTWYVGTHGLGAILITSPEGHALLDGGLPESAPLIIDNVRTLGFRVEDIRLIVNSHAHYDHSGGIAALQRASGADVAAHPWSAAVMRLGRSLPQDPQYSIALRYPAVASIREIADGDTLRVGAIALTAHFTGGHTPGGTSWSWTSCEGERCVRIVYADSQTPVSADDFLYTRNDAYPTAVADFERGFTVLERLRCDVLLTPHPGASRLFQRLAAREAGDATAMIDSNGCRAYAGTARQSLARRITREKGGE